MSLTDAPPISEVDPNSLPFRAALYTACEIVGKKGNAYSRHDHGILRPGEAMIEQPVAPGKLKLRPLPKKKARLLGLPSCWAFTPEREIVELRYTDWQMAQV